LTTIRADGYKELGGNRPPQETLGVQQSLRFPLQQWSTILSDNQSA
jgi:hypothetical protein